MKIIKSADFLAERTATRKIIAQEFMKLGCDAVLEHNGEDVIAKAGNYVMKTVDKKGIYPVEASIFQDTFDIIKDKNKVVEHKEGKKVSIRSFIKTGKTSKKAVTIEYMIAKEKLQVETLEGTVLAKPRNYIVKGEIWTITKATFLTLYHIN